MALTLLNFYTMRPFSFFRTLAAVALLSVSCSKSDAVDPNDPNAQLPDPSGTITLSMRNANSGTTYLADSNIYIDKADNFTGATFVSLGPVRGLGNVNYIPKTGWVSKIAVVPGEGYVAYSNGTFYRIYVTGYTTNVSNEIIGAEVKYQTPFGGADEAITVANTTQTFGAESEVRDILFTNKGVIPCTVAAEGACTASLIYADDYSFLPIGVRVEVEMNDLAFERQGKVIVRATNGKTTEISIVQKGARPYVFTEGVEVFLDCSAQSKFFKIYTNLSGSDLNVTSDADWCDASLEVGETPYLYLSVTENTVKSVRKATIVVSSKDGKARSDDLIVYQSGPSIFLDKESPIEMSAAAGTVNVAVSGIGSSQWEVTSDKGWCRVTKSGASFEIAVDENNDGTDRSATVTARVNEENSTSIIVTQSKHTFTLSAEELNFDRQMQNSSVTLETTASGFSAVSSDPSWCSLSWNDKVMTVRATANDTQQNRVATITVSLSDNQSKTIQVAQSRYMIGDYYEENGVKGVVFVLEGFHGKLLSVDESFLQWSVETVDIGATDENDGMANINKIKQIPNWQTLYPAFAWCEAKNTDGVTGWYLPAQNELKIVFDNVTSINNGLSSCGGTTLKISSSYSYYYWSSTQSDSSNAVTLYRRIASSTSSGYSTKTTSRYVRAVRAF